MIKPFIHGFKQDKAVALGLTNDDLLVLRWVVDFFNTSKMTVVLIDGKQFFWVNYATVAADLPILRQEKRTIARGRFGNLCKSGVLECRILDDNASYYCYGISYKIIEYLQDESPVESWSQNATPGVKTPTPLESKRHPPGVKTPSIYTNTINTNTIDTKKEVGTRAFLKPTLIELSDFCKKNAIHIDCQNFLDYYDSNGWKVGKSPMKDWKATARRWGRANNASGKGKQAVNYDEE